MVKMQTTKNWIKRRRQHEDLGCVFGVLCDPVPAPAGGGGRARQRHGKAYNVEVRSVDVVYSLDGTFRALETVRTTGRQENVNSVRFAYDFEQEQPEAVGRFLEDQKVALVRVDGFDPRIGAIAEAERVAVTVDGQELQADRAADFADYVGWHNVHSGSYGVVFPIFLGKESRQETHVVQVTALLTQDGVEREITETAVLTLALENEHLYKEERALRILNMAGTHVDAYCVGDRIYGLSQPGLLQLSGVGAEPRSARGGGDRVCGRGRQAIPASPGRRRRAARPGRRRPSSWRRRESWRTGKGGLLRKAGQPPRRAAEGGLHRGDGRGRLPARRR